jgi:hypothetical protein
MYIPYQFLMAIENDRLRDTARHRVRAQACRERNARIAREAEFEARQPHRGLGRRVARTFGRRPATGTAA